VTAIPLEDGARALYTLAMYSPNSFGNLLPIDSLLGSWKDYRGRIRWMDFYRGGSPVSKAK